jgi:hypothetical protein
VFNDGPRDLSNRSPNWNTRSVYFDFVGAATANGSGNYGGVMTFAPWTGTTASTGDSSYQLAFGNTTGVNASGQPKLSIRNGIDSTWNSWYVLLHSGNVGSYALTAESDTLATVTARGATTASLVRINNQLQVGQNTNGTAWIDAYGGFAYYGADSNSTGMKINSSGVAAFSNAVSVTPTTTGVSTGLTVINGDITTYRSGGTTGVIYFGTSGGKYLYYDATNYSMPGGQLDVNGSRVLNAGNYNSYSPTLTGGSASGTWGISITGSAGSAPANGGTATALNSSNYISQRGSTGSWNGDFQTNPAGTYAYGGDVGSNGTNGPGGSWWFQDNYRHTNSSNYWGTQIAWGWEDNANKLAQRNISSNVFSGWVYYLNSGNYNSYSPTLTGGSASGTWGINITGNAGGSSTSCSGNAATATRAAGNFYIDTNYGRGIVGVYDSTRYQGVFAMGDSYKLADDGTTVGNLYGIAWSHPNAGGAAGNLDSHGLLVLINGGYGSSMSYSIKASSNVTAYSDERLKTNWRAMPENFVERLAQVRVGIYDRIDGEKITQVGVSAQSLQKLLPQAIETANDEIGTLSVNYGSAALASAVELAKDNMELRNRIEKLEALVLSLLNKE